MTLWRHHNGSMKAFSLRCRQLAIFTVAAVVLCYLILEAPRKKRQAYVFVATDDKYAERALVPAYSLREVETSMPIVLICTPGVASVSRFRNLGIFDEVVIRPLLEIPQDINNPNLALRPWLTKTFSKLSIWTLTSYTKLVYLDSDVLVVKNIDDLFEREELSAGPEDLWPDVFNSGVLVIEPSLKTYTKLVQRARLKPSWDGTDQGLLNDVFGDQWRNVPRRRLPYTYNMAYSTFKIYRSAHDRYKDQVKVVHFLGTFETKPWDYILNKTTNKLQPDADIYVKKWWQVYFKYVKGL